MSALRLHRELAAIWATGPGLQRLAAVNHSVIGLRFIASASEILPGPGFPMKKSDSHM